MIRLPIPYRQKGNGTGWIIQEKTRSAFRYGCGSSIFPQDAKSGIPLGIGLREKFQRDSTHGHPYIDLNDGFQGK